MKKRMFVLLGALLIGSAAFAESRYTLDYEPIVQFGFLSVDSESQVITASNWLGLHTTYFWDKVSVGFGFKGLCSNINLDVGYNIFNLENFVWSVGARVVLDGLECPGIGASTNLDLFLNMSERISFNLGTSLGYVFYPTVGSTVVAASDGAISKCSFTTFDIEPRIGVCIKQ